MSGVQDGWGGILGPDEDILWQGRPDGAIRMNVQSAGKLGFGLLFAGFALFWMIMASQAGGFFWMFGLIHFFVGLGVAFGGVFLDAYKRRHTWYTLSNRNAFIATDLPWRGKSLKTYPITPETVLDFIDGPLATIHFASAPARRRRRGRSGPHAIGFEYINDGANIFRMMRDLQKRQLS